jgi:hypothetical protein
MLEPVDIGHYAKIPIHIARAKVSKSAKSLWIELALVSSPEKPQVWIRQESIAEKMDVSDRTVRRLITELENARLITRNGWFQCRHKKYDLSWTDLSDVGGQNGQECPTSPDENVQLHRTKMSRDGGQKRPDLNRVIVPASQQNLHQALYSRPQGMFLFSFYLVVEKSDISITRGIEACRRLSHQQRDGQSSYSCQSQQSEHASL